MKVFDVVVLTDSRYVNPARITPYISNVLLEDGLIQTALEKKGLRTARKDWADPDFDWNTTRAVLFRTTWDYFDNISAFRTWLSKIDELGVESINPIRQIEWNMDKWYLRDLAQKGIPIVETRYIKKGEKKSLKQVIEEAGFSETILKPTVGGGARHTYHIRGNSEEFEGVFAELVRQEDLMLQPFLQHILIKGEISLIVINGTYTHAVLKKAKAGDFRVQDDYGGTVQSYRPSPDEISLAEKTAAACTPLPAYARIDVMWNNNGKAVVSEVELIEPELWFREHNEAADILADVIFKRLQAG